MENKKQLQNYLKISFPYYKQTSRYLFISLILAPGIALTAPDVSPKLSNPESNTFQTLRSDEGFLFSQLDTSWFNSPTPEDKENIHLLFRSPVVTNGFQPIMTVRVDNSVGEA